MSDGTVPIQPTLSIESDQQQILIINEQIYVKTTQISLTLKFLPFFRTQRISRL